MKSSTLLAPCVLALLIASCAEPQRCGANTDSEEAVDDDDRQLPLCLVKDVELTGNVSRFDYQDVDAPNHQLILAHMGDSAVIVFDLDTDQVKATLTDIPTVRGVLAAPSVNRLYATASASDELVIIDATRLEVVKRVSTGTGPDGLAWDGVSHVVAISAQRAGQVTLIADDGEGTRTDVDVGNDTGNVAFHDGRGSFFATVVSPEQLVEISPAGDVLSRIDLPGCAGAHGLRFHPDGKSALVACEVGGALVRVSLEADHAIVSAGTALGPDVLSVDPGFGWIYVAAEGGDLRVFDINGAGLTELVSQNAGGRAHSVAVDPATHKVYLPLEDGGAGKPVLRILSP